LRLPANSAMVSELCDIPHVNWRPPFYGPRKTAIFYWRRLTEGDIRPENYRWGTFGPMFLTYLAKKHGVALQAKERSVFYPVRHRHAKLLCGPPELVTAGLTNQTRTIHLCRPVLDREARVSPPRGSYLEAACRRHDVDFPIGEAGRGREVAEKASKLLYGVAGATAQ